MENPIIVPFDLNTARKIKSGEIEGSVLIGNIKIEFVYESKDCADRYNLLFVKKDESGISAIYADTEGRTFFNNVLELEVEAGAYFKKGDVLISTLGNPFIYNGIINREGDMGCIYGISAYGEITSEEVPIWTSVCGEDKSKYVRLATEEEKKSFAERIANTENLKKAGIIKQYLSEYEYLLTKEKKCDFKPFDQADRALINKVYHMLFDIGSDFESVIRMLYSFRNGPKSGIKVADPEDNYEWTNKDGNEKYSTKNLPKAHFRWDWRRYTLSKESVDKITEFVDTILKS